jgi:hypothetical protein
MVNPEMLSNAMNIIVDHTRSEIPPSSTATIGSPPAKAITVD